MLLLERDRQRGEKDERIHIANGRTMQKMMDVFNVSDKFESSLSY